MAHRHAAAVRASRDFGPLARRDRSGGCIIISRFSWRGIPQCPPIRQVFGAGWMPISLDADAASAAVPIIGLAVSTAAKESQQQQNGTGCWLWPLGLPIIDDILEPIELMWEFYTARDEIQEQMLANAGKFLKKKSVQALGFAGMAAAGAEVLARVGFIGDRGEGIAEYVRESEKIKERLRKLDDTIDEQMPGVMARSFRSCFRRYRALPERAKFAIAFSTGATLQQTIINTAVSVIKLSVGSFVVLETMAFCGIIGEPGESIMEWIEDHDDELKERFDKKWGVKTKKFRQTCRKCLSLEGMIELYEAAVDEEKVATFGMGLGMVAGSLV